MRTVPDMDGDGLLDLEEATLRTNALNSDTDGDGFGDGEEVLVLRTDPLDAHDPSLARRGRGRRRRELEIAEAIHGAGALALAATGCRAGLPGHALPDSNGRAGEI